MDKISGVEKISGETKTSEGNTRVAILTKHGQAEHRYLDAAGGLHVVGQDQGGGAVLYTCVRDKETLTVIPTTPDAVARGWLSKHLQEGTA